ncbi:AAA family ATPase [Denitromonas sp.]|uniref:AAA family ATPase n=1 Tax=Denitromonas sp. TaxID=2734609 RepID=UPI002AFF3E20|nr:AAA family ATPase [Denitromonas sp.]
MTVDLAHTLLAHAGQVLLGKAPQLRLALCCMLARGHLLIEDVPGVGKTTLAHLLARLPGLAFQRIQFTSDLLPADILGVSVFDRNANGFHFHRGPIFSQLILADEINRATPKTQSALLEAMEEGQITADGSTYPLPAPFFVIATQNPSSQVGTFPLPESQLDRFLMRLQLGYPDPAAERALLLGENRRDLLAALAPVIDPDTLVQMQHACARVHVADPLADYVQALLEASRRSDDGPGLSPRAGLALVGAARAWAWLDRRDHVEPEDIQRIFAAVAGHRLGLDHSVAAADARCRALIEGVPLP